MSARIKRYNWIVQGQRTRGQMVFRLSKQQSQYCWDGKRRRNPDNFTIDRFSIVWKKISLSFELKIFEHFSHSFHVDLTIGITFLSIPSWMRDILEPKMDQFLLVFLKHKTKPDRNLMRKSADLVELVKKCSPNFFPLSFRIKRN